MMFCSNPTLQIVDVRKLMKTTLTPSLSNLYNNLISMGAPHGISAGGDFLCIPHCIAARRGTTLPRGRVLPWMYKCI